MPSEELQNLNKEVLAKIKEIFKTSQFPKFMLFLLEDPEWGAIHHYRLPQEKDGIQNVINLYSHWVRFKKPPKAHWDAFRTSASESATSWAIKSYSCVSNANYAAGHCLLMGFQESKFLEGRYNQRDKLDELIEEEANRVFGWKDY